MIYDSGFVFAVTQQFGRLTYRYITYTGWFLTDYITQQCWAGRRRGIN